MERMQEKQLQDLRRHTRTLILVSSGSVSVDGAVRNLYIQARETLEKHLKACLELPEYPTGIYGSMEG